MKSLHMSDGLVGGDTMMNDAQKTQEMKVEIVSTVEKGMWVVVRLYF